MTTGRINQVASIHDFPARHKLTKQQGPGRASLNATENLSNRAGHERPAHSVIRVQETSNAQARRGSRCYERLKRSARPAFESARTSERCLGGTSLPSHTIP